ncbi:MAG: LTA synthase family protein [Planctomycetota bacterium]|jgi:phosphoglycerol transferase|nr:LTA synthase family protein [Planctomycetota bacterium]
MTTRANAYHLHAPFLRLAAVLDGVIIAVYLCRDWRLMRWTREFLRRFVKVKIVAPTVPVYFCGVLFFVVFLIETAHLYHQRFTISFAQIIAHWGYLFDDGLAPVIIGFLLEPLPLGIACVAVGVLLIVERLRLNFERKFFGVAAALLIDFAVIAVAHYVGAFNYLTEQMRTPSVLYEQRYLAPQAIEISFPEKKRNLIVIFVESLDTGFLTKADGGAFDDDLLPNIKKLAMENLNFSQTEKIGGEIQCHGTNYTLAGIVSNLAGISPDGAPLLSFLNHAKKPLSGEKFMPGAVALGDILAANGYREYHLGGYDSSFAGMGSFFKTHGNAEIFDISYFKRAGVLPANYSVWWGFEDRKLYQFAQEKLTAVAQQSEPFFFTMTTLDTHPTGYLDPQAERKFPALIENVWADADKLLGEFIAWLKQQDFYENTTVVILGDHLYMDNTVFPPDFDAGQEYGNGARRPLNIFINSPLSPKFAKNRQFSHFDLFPTLVEAVGGKINAPGLGLGRSMSSGEKTLLEELGYAAVNDQLQRPSRRYDELWTLPNGGAKK